MFDGLKTLGKWLMWALIILIVLASLLPNGWHVVGAAIGDLLHHFNSGVHTATHHAKHGS